MPPLYPMMVDLRGRRCLVVGGGAVASRKVAALLRAGAAVTVVSPALSPALARLAAGGRVSHRARPYRGSDLRGAWLAIGATDDPDVNARLGAEAARRGILVNVADAPRLCAFQVPSVVRRGDLTIAISTGGTSPALARRIRQDLEAIYPPGFGRFLGAMRRLRRRAQRELPDARARRAVFALALDSELRRASESGRRGAVDRAIDQLFEFVKKSRNESPDARKSP